MSQSPPGKLKAVFAYATFIGLIIVYFINREDRHSYTTWHVKNMFGLLILLFISQIMQSYYPTAGLATWWVVFFLWAYSIIMAIANKKQGIPLLSDKFQEWFTFLN